MPPSEHPLKQFDPPDESQYCDEIAAVLAAMRAIEPIKVVAMGYENIKSPTFYSILDRAPSEQMLEAASALKSSYPTLNFTPFAIACLGHDSAIEWKAPERSVAGRFWRWLTKG